MGHGPSQLTWRARGGHFSVPPPGIKSVDRAHKGYTYDGGPTFQNNRCASMVGPTFPIIFQLGANFLCYHVAPDFLFLRGGPENFAGERQPPTTKKKKTSSTIGAIVPTIRTAHAKQKASLANIFLQLLGANAASSTSQNVL